MKLFTFGILISVLLSAGVSKAQKYALIDKKMGMPVSYTNTVTLQHDYAGLFPIEKQESAHFVAALETILKQLNSGKIPPPSKYNVGCTTFKTLRIPLKDEDRMDVVVTSDCGATLINLHLVDAKSTNASNAYFVSTWLKYIKKEFKIGG